MLHIPADGSGVALSTADPRLTNMPCVQDAHEAMLHAVRGRIVEYKEALLRQLVEQRVALLAMEKVEAASPTHANEVVEVAGDKLAEIVATSEVASANGECSDEHSSAVAIDTKPEVDTVAMQPNADEPRVIDASSPRLLARSMPVTTPPSRRRRRSESVLTELRGQRIVQRTSMPPTRYRDRSDRDEPSEMEVEQSHALVLRSPRKVLTRGESRDHLSAKRSSAGLAVDVNKEFARQLETSLRLNQDVSRCTATATRKRQLPRLPVPSRTRSHWDYLLEEMKWMAMDFTHERNWKRVMQYHLAKDVIVAQNAERVRCEKENRQLAREIALQVSAFWRTIERIAARSRVRFERGGESSIVQDDKAFAATNGTLDKSDENPGDTGFAEDAPVLIKFKRVDAELEARQIDRVRERVEHIVGVGRKARSMMNPTIDLGEIHTQREEALARLQESLSTCQMLAAFQLQALRWMLELRSSGANMLLNDQLGMGKTATIAAFLRVVSLMDPMPADMDVSRPHLVISSPANLHKWAYFTRAWNPGVKIQVYDGSVHDRQRLQRDWSKKLNAEHFMSAPEVRELEAEESRPIFCCICPITLFLQDQEAFARFNKWEMMIVENEHHALFEDSNCIEALKRVRQQQQRILCTGQPLDSWSSNNLRWQWAEFLVGGFDISDWTRDDWTRHTVLEKDSAVVITKLFGRANALILKPQSDQVCALLVALCCLSLRRARSDVETQLGKIDEHTLACRLTPAQKTQYRLALTAFASSRSDHEERIEAWLQLFLRLRTICNCVDLLHDQEKLALADLEFMRSSSGKIAALADLLPRLVHKERRRVVVYCQLEALLVVIEMMLVRLQMTYVRITGSLEMQQRGLCHFSLHPSIQVVLASTRLACWQGRRSMTVYGADAVVVVDSDWNSLCDCKLRASWAQLAVSRELPVYRCHCEDTIEGALLRVGASLSDKVFCEMSPQEVVAIPVDGLVKPSWWATANSSSSELQSTLGRVMKTVEAQEKYCCNDLEQPLQVEPAELDAEEHLLLANADELTPVEWYAVHYVHHVTEVKRHAQDADMEVVHDDTGAVSSLVELTSAPSLFEEFTTRDLQDQWQERRSTSQLFYEADRSFIGPGLPDEDAEAVVPALLSKLHLHGSDVDYTLVAPPRLCDGAIPPDAGSVGDFQSVFQARYRVPAPPPPPPKQKPESGEVPLKVKLKKQRSRVKDTVGVKRKPETSLPTKPSRVDLDGIPLPDLSEFEDDDFWSNLDVLDSASWEDIGVPPSILGGSGSIESSPATSVNSTSVTNGPTVKRKKTASAGAGATGRARKGSVGSAPGEATNRDPWSTWDDLVLKKLFELYGSNWTLIAQVFNASTSVSRYFTRKRTPRQCYDRYGKIIAGSLSSSSTTPAVAKENAKGDTTGTSKPQKATASIPTPDVLAKRVGIPPDEELLTFALRDSLPGVPPPSTKHLQSPLSVDLRINKTQKAGEPSPAIAEQFKSMRASFDAITQCVKRKVPPPPIPLPIVSSADSSASRPSDVSTPTSISGSAATSPGTVQPATPTPPHKSHLDLVEMLPRGALAPDEVIRRSKEAAAVAVQAAAAVASVGRDATASTTPQMTSVGDVMMGAAFGSASVAAARKARAASANLGPPPQMNANPMPPQAMPPPANIAWGSVSPPMRGPGGHVPAAAGGMAGVDPVAPNGPTMPVSTNGPNDPMAAAANRHAMPMTTSALLHVLDRMPEIKNRIQAILNRNDCSEAQKVAMIARLLSNTNAINATAVAAAASGHIGPSSQDAAMALRSIGVTQSLDTPLPMPEALAHEPTPPSNLASSAPAVDVEMALNGPGPSVGPHPDLSAMGPSAGPALPFGDPDVGRPDLQ